MKNLKKVVASLLILTMSISMTMTAFAAENDMSTVQCEEEIVYSETINLNDAIVPFARDLSKTVTANKSLGLALAVGERGESVPVSFRFSTLPSNAVVKSIEIIPGTAVVNNNNRNMMGAILIESITITDPNFLTATLPWKASGFENTSAFLNRSASGTWTAFITGRNIARPSGNPTMDLKFFGSVSYKSAQIKITYVLDDAM